MEKTGWYIMQEMRRRMISPELDRKLQLIKVKLQENERKKRNVKRRRITYIDACNALAAKVIITSGGDIDD